MLLKNEKKYEFRKRMRTIHKKNIRNLNLLPCDDEYCFKNGVCLVLPESAGDVTITAARDFEEYMLTSMKVSVMTSFIPCGNDLIPMFIDDTMRDDYIIEISSSIKITAKNERALAQALYYLEDKMSERKAPFIKKGMVNHKFLFSPRMVHSGYALDTYPDEHLSAIAHAGMDAILIFVSGVNKTPSGYMDFNELIDRAAKYGLDVYAYSYMKSKMHPSDSGAKEFYDNLYGNLFRECPGFKGVILVGESVGFPSHDERTTYPGTEKEKPIFPGGDDIPSMGRHPGWWPCNDYHEWLECVKNTIRAQKKDADVVFWTYNWGYAPEEDRIKLINSLPTDISLLVTFEMFETYKCGDFIKTTTDYTLSFEGPGNYFLTEAEAAKKRGIRLYTMSNTGGLTWDMGTVPYEPMPYQWIKRYKALVEAKEKFGLCGLMESHHYGLWPSFISDLAKKCFINDNSNMENSLTEVIQKHFDHGNEDLIKEALKNWSEAIVHFTPSEEDQYGAFRVGPSYPLGIMNVKKPPSEEFAHFGNRILMVNYPFTYSNDTGPSGMTKQIPFLRVRKEIPSLEKAFSYMREGLDILNKIENPNEELLYLINLGEYISCCIRTGINAKKWFVTISEIRACGDKDKLVSLLAEAKDIIYNEIENAKSAIPLVQKDSRLGYEPSMDYICSEDHIRWKLKHADYVLKREFWAFERDLELENLQ